MNKTRKFIEEFSLSQQLLVIIFTFTITFTGFFVILLGPNLTEFVEMQIYTVLDISQNNIEFSLEQDMPLSSLSDSDNTTVSHLIMQEGEIHQIGSFKLTRETRISLLNEIEQLQEITNSKFTDINGRVIYYTVHRENDLMIVSYMYDTYGLQIRGALLNSIINVTVFIVFALFLLLLLWVATIITPLRQIRIFVDKYKVGQKSELKIDRKDEIGELANALVQLTHELEYQEEHKTQLIHNISHDLKTPIATIKSYGESIKDGIYPYETLEKSVDVIIEHATRLEKKVHSLLLLNRLSFQDEKSVVDTIEEVDMCEVIEQTILAIKVIKPHINIDCNLKPATFMGNKENWRITTENIIDNALRYAKSTIWITLDQDELIIENDGSSISEEKLHSIFRAYEKGTDGNFGLGLSIAYKAVTQAGYFIVAENTDRGVAFRIFKPNFK
ncbi:MAG: HAMP domain-containing histidine kinase [Erysipelotrichales bacterium]|nr:HAMP domain-containing histidine kinase [Erysipelotrichales bacterium]